jgi:hypothetical protein
LENGTLEKRNEGEGMEKREEREERGNADGLI